MIRKVALTLYHLCDVKLQIIQTPPRQSGWQADRNQVVNLNGRTGERSEQASGLMSDTKISINKKGANKFL